MLIMRNFNVRTKTRKTYPGSFGLLAAGALLLSGCKTNEATGTAVMASLPSSSSALQTAPSITVPATLPNRSYASNLPKQPEDSSVELTPLSTRRTTPRVTCAISSIIFSDHTKPHIIVNASVQNGVYPFGLTIGWGNGEDSTLGGYDINGAPTHISLIEHVDNYTYPKPGVYKISAVEEFMSGQDQLTTACIGSATVKVVS
jgi:hypothetical protein